MCKVTQLLLAMLLSLGAIAQGVFSNKTNAALKQVIEDFPNHFNNIKGDELSTYEPAVNYQSKVVVPGSVACTLTRYKTNESYSWNCELFSSSDFQKAQTRYSELFKEIHNTIIKLEGQKPSILNGRYEVPAIGIKQHTIPFNFLPATGIIQKLHVEMQMTSDGGVWKITLKVYEDAISSQA